MRMMVMHVMVQVRRLRWKRMMIERRRRRRMVVEVIGVNLWIRCCRRCDISDGRRSRKRWRLRVERHRRHAVHLRLVHHSVVQRRLMTEHVLLQRQHRHHLVLIEVVNVFVD